MKGHLNYCNSMLHIKKNNEEFAILTQQSLTPHAHHEKRLHVLNMKRIIIQNLGLADQHLTYYVKKSNL